MTSEQDRLIQQAADAIAGIQIDIGPNARNFIADGTWTRMHLAVYERHEIARTLHQAGFLTDPPPTTIHCGCHQYSDFWGRKQHQHRPPCLAATNQGTPADPT